ncbi:hypothetical protein KDJ56_20990 [Brevibacillus composti]|uniref:Uncharacterized protein n=1 Tax=Brevibacillus composti TaxID=2796470 RepID=A0A7T5JNN9_9BACL|nr:hypothetical protein [Brevibacillus composti]QQE74282.1 hypothetical protein JD108_21055 [Brevibacillus composti]QUO41364.1 hypothetical protein KDJ56_20990 [Brevibacillus composti]
MKKVLITVLFTMLISSSVLAAGNDDIKRTNRYQSIKNELTSSGLSTDEAEHYAYLTELVKDMEERGIEFSLDHQANENSINSRQPDITDEYVNSHPREYKERIRKLDKEVWKKELIALAQQEDRMAEVQKIIDKERKKGKLKDHYEVKFSDGTVFSVKFETSETDPQRAEEMSRELFASSYEILPHIAGPWNYSTHIDTHTTPDRSDHYTTGPSWEFKQGISYSKVAIVHHFYLNNNNTPGNLSDDAVSTNTQATSGAAAGYGVVNVTEEPIKNTITYAKGISKYIQSYQPVTAKVSSAFSASFLGLSMQVPLQAGNNTQLVRWKAQV